MKALLVLLSLYWGFCFGQNNFIFQSDYYKEQGLRFHRNYFPDGAYPKNEAEFGLLKAINDSSKQYYTFTDILFKKHLVEIKGDGFNLNISPILDLSMGRDLSDSVSRSLSRTMVSTSPLPLATSPIDHTKTCYFQLETAVILLVRDTAVCY